MIIQDSMFYHTFWQKFHEKCHLQIISMLSVSLSNLFNLIFRLSHIAAKISYNDF